MARALRWRSNLACGLAAALVAAWAPGAAGQGALPTGFEDRLVAGGLELPAGFALLPDGRALVVEQYTARIRLIIGGPLAEPGPVVTIPDVSLLGDEQGVLGIAVDPGWPSRPYVYVHCDNLGTFTIRISRYTVTGDLGFTGAGNLSIDPASRRDLIDDLPDSAPNHNGGTLRFGPDGRLYASIGEDGQRCMAQDDSTLHGVIMRLDVSRLPEGPGGPPAIGLITPPDNPQVSSGNPRTRLIFAFGLRNPFRFSIDPRGGALYIGDVGQGRYEEINRAASAPLDFGWPAFEGPASFDPACPTAIAPTGPIYYYDRTGFRGGAAVVGGVLYRAPPGASRPFPPEYEGDFFFSDYFQGLLGRLKNNGGAWSLAPPVPGQPATTDWGQGFEGVSDYLIARDGSIWYCRQTSTGQSGTGEIRRISSSAGAPRPEPIATLALPIPTPAKGSAELDYVLSVPSRVSLTIYDLRGREVRRIVAGEDQSAGPHRYTWDGLDADGRSAAAGFYFVRLDAGGFHLEQRLPLIR